MAWPTTPDDLAREQERLASRAPEPWEPPQGAFRVGACAVVFGRGNRDDIGWAAVVVEEAGEVVATSTHVARIGAPFLPGKLALREGPILEAVVRHSRDGRTSCSSPPPGGITRVAPASRSTWARC